MDDEVMGYRYMHCDCMTNMSVHCSRAVLEPLMVYSRSEVEEREPRIGQGEANAMSKSKLDMTDLIWRSSNSLAQVSLLLPLTGLSTLAYIMN